MNAEYEVQLMFSKSFWLQALTLLFLIGAAGYWLSYGPPRHELGPRSAEVRFAAVALRPADYAPLRLAGAWTLTSSDPRFGGVSALAIDGDALLALTDSGVLIRFAKPGRGRGGGPANVFELPGGPGSGKLKRDRDSEALLRDPRGRGWWVGFENWNQLWLYDLKFQRAVDRIDFGIGRWPDNLGIEGLASDGGDLLIFPERGKSVVRLIGASATTMAVTPADGRISDAARLPSGARVVLHRDRSWFGLVNRLSWIEASSGGGFKTLRTIRLGPPGRDNFEALAAESLPGGAVRLWLMTDDNFQRPMRTLLIALDVPASKGR